MRKELLLALTLIVPVSATAAKLNIERPSTKYLSNASVRTACNGRVETACTTFEQATLDCECALRDGQWRTDVTISAQPKMYLSNMMYHLHELSHVFDFEYAMKHHAAEMESRSFAKEEECEIFAKQQQFLFPSVLKKYVHSSMRLRDGLVLANRE